MSLEQYFNQTGNLRALVIRSAYQVEGIEFLTPPEQSQQLGIMKRPEGYQVDPHKHIEQQRTIEDTNEVLIVRSGLLRIELFDDNQKVTDTFEVGPGDTVLLGADGHGITFVQESIVIEVKQGPYSQINDKVRFQRDA